ncbi:MAG: hypothetical protein ABII09_02485 [Planctomycetota bacterium]
MGRYIRKYRNYHPDMKIPMVILPDFDSVRSGGFVLLITLVVLLVLATLGYNFSSRLAADRHRNNYVIDYTIASYARDSAMKYALAALQDLNDIKFISRPNEPDFSDLFAMSEPDYRKLLEQWAEKIANNQSQFYGRTNTPAGLDKDLNISGLDENSDAASASAEPNILDLLTIPGPYGPPWPLVAEPVEFEIGPATVKFRIEDENAKYPAGWALIDDIKAQREAQAGLETFCEWMGYDSDRIDSLKKQLKEVGSIKPFKTDFKPIVRREEVTPRRPVVRSRRRVVTGRAVFRTVTIAPAEQIIGQARDFSKLFHSSLIDVETLARPTIISEDRKESALKYMGLWGTTQVNVNSAPRHVLEAAFAFGGDADKIADEIIKIRREKPFTDLEDLKKRLFRYSDAIEKCRPYIMVTSNIFAIHITAVSGAAKSSAVIIVYKEGDKIQRIAVVCG